MRRAAGVVLLTVALAGCASFPYVGRGVILIDAADKLAREGDAAGAVAKYDEYLARYPNGWWAKRAQESRETLVARTEATRLRQEVMRLRDELARREGDLVRVRQEADRLRSDLERLKQIDLQLERSR